MISEALNITGTSLQKVPSTADQVESGRKKAMNAQETVSADSSKKSVQTEEVLNKIKALTEDGIYSVRFENDDITKEMVVKIVDSQTEEVIRQVPPEEVLGLRKALADYQGNLIDTTS